jgi:hypothetical protein
MGSRSKYGQSVRNLIPADTKVFSKWDELKAMAMGNRASRRAAASIIRAHKRAEASMHRPGKAVV